MINNSTGKNEDFYTRGKQMFDRINSSTQTSKESSPKQKQSVVYEFKCSQCGYTQNEEIDMPNRPWVGLTDEEVDYLIHLAYTGDEEFVQTIEVKLKEKNKL